jgi:transketolase
MGFAVGPRRGVFVDISDEIRAGLPLSAEELGYFTQFDLVYRSLCAVLYNYVPMSGHPGGSISSGRFVAGILFDALDYDCSRPDREDADIISYAAGHKALGLYAMWALRNEVLRLGAPELLPDDIRQQLRLEDLLGFRRNPVNHSLLFTRFNAKALDGHPTPATPFVRLATGASGVAVSTSQGLAFGARDYFGENAPHVHIVEGEGGMTPGRVAEAMAAAGTAALHNVVMHVDWNQASIDSNHVCRDGKTPGDYVQWNPMELAWLHDWNVIEVADGRNIQHVIAAQRKADCLRNTQPTAIVYRTVKGWRYGIEGRASHGAGHKLCTDNYFMALEPMLGEGSPGLPVCCEPGEKRCMQPDGTEVLEACFWQALEVIRGEMESRRTMVEYLAMRLKEARSRLEHRARKPRTGAPNLQAAYDMANSDGLVPPDELRLEPGTKTTLRAELGRILNHYNKATNGAFMVSAADLLDSTSIAKAADGFAPGYYDAASNPDARRLSIGGICEDAMAGVASGLSSFGHHIGVASSYGAFIAPLGHIAARLHAIGNQARRATAGEPYKPIILTCAHAGLKTGEDGPTHADPQPLQLLQGNFPPGTLVTLTPWDPQEIWSLLSTALAQRPSVIAPFVTRPNETVPDRAALRLAPPEAAREGVYLLRKAQGEGEGTLVLQGSGVTIEFVCEVLPQLDRDGVDLDVFYVASAELFDALNPERRKEIFPEWRARQAMGITGFTLPTMYRWVTSEQGRAATAYPFKKGHFLGSGQANMVLREAGLDGDGQYEAIRAYLDQRVKV